MPRKPPLTRRNFLKRSSSIVAAASLSPLIFVPRYARPSNNRLRILQWNHFVPQFDEWFNNVYVKEWGKANGIEVQVDNVGMTSLHGRAAAEIAAQDGHDLVMFLRPSPKYEDHVIDHREIYQECERKYGRPIDIATKSTYNPRTRKYFGFSDSYVPDPVNYRKDLWDDVGVSPDSWENIRQGGRKIKERHGIPIGIGMAPELDSNMALRTLLYAFGASVQTADGEPNLRSPETLEALKFMKALYDETMTDEVFAWDASSNNRQMLAGRGSLTLNAISITRTGETMKVPVSERIWLQKPARGPVRTIGLIHLMDFYVIWKFSKNIDAAKQFLVDYVGNFRQAFLSSAFYNFPCFPETVPDLQNLISTDEKATPKDKYNFFKDVTDWTTNLGYPGYANAAVDEIFSRWSISNMFAEVAKGRMTPQDAMNATAKEIDEIYSKWRQVGKI